MPMLQLSPARVSLWRNTLLEITIVILASDIKGEWTGGKAHRRVGVGVGVGGGGVLGVHPTFQPTSS